jgi:hypothetical protein
MIEIPTRIPKLIEKSQNSDFYLASLKLQFLPLSERNLSVSDGLIPLNEVFFISIRAIPGMKMFTESTKTRSLDPQ